MSKTSAPHVQPIADGWPQEVIELRDSRKRPMYYLGGSVDEKMLRKLFLDLKGRSLADMDLIVNSRGGYPDQAYQIVRVLKRHAKRLTCFVPRFAKSAATVICLGADEIVFGELGELGPVDMQTLESVGGDVSFRSALNHAKAVDMVQRYALTAFDTAVRVITQRSGLTVKEAVSLAAEVSSGFAGPLFSQISPYKLGESSQLLKVSVEYCRRVLVRYHGFTEKDAREAAEALTMAYPHHGFVIDAHELKGILPQDDCQVAVRDATDDEQVALSLLAAIEPDSAAHSGFVGGMPPACAPSQPPPCGVQETSKSPAPGEVHPPPPAGQSETKSTPGKDHGCAKPSTAA